MDLSIVIPLYNVERYVIKCLDSVLHQRNIEQLQYEVIIVNDGSTDNSYQIAKDYTKSFPNVRIVSQINQGLSVARNKGLSLACGEYVWFIDSDDWIAETSLLEIISLCKKENLDLLGIVAIDVLSDSKIIRYDFKDRENILFSGIQYLKLGLHSFCVPFTIYKRKYLNEHNFFFKIGIFHEDVEFSPRVYYYANRVMYINKPLYYVRQTPNSITRSINPQKAYDYIAVCYSLFDFSLTVQLSYRCIYYNFISLCINNALSTILQSDLSTQMKFNEFLYKNRILFSFLRKSSILKYKIEGYLFFVFGKHVLKIYNLLIRFK